jgi:predicted metal-dependent phosphoesterase TrpH
MRPTRGYKTVGSPPAGCELLDLHNHTAASHDSTNTLPDYERAYDAGLFNILAITDHNTIDGAVDFQARATFPVIAGEEVDTADGELIGLFLSDPIPLDLPAVETAELIRSRGGLVYLQHPFYRLIRRPLRRDTISELARRDLIDVVEGVNGGPFMWLTDGHARGWAESHGIPCGAGSDAHHPGDIGWCAAAIRPVSSELTPKSLLDRLEGALLVERRRSSVSSLRDRSRYWVACASGRSPRKTRVPEGVAQGNGLDVGP